MAHAQQADLPVISDLTQFDFNSGTFLERLVFNNRTLVMLLCLAGKFNFCAVAPVPVSTVYYFVIPYGPTWVRKN